MEVLEFRKIKTSDRFDTKYEAWSRIYEYPLVLDIIKKYYKSNDISLHNSSWGFTGCHVTFKEEIDSLYPNCIHSDILKSNLEKTKVWDITTTPDTNWIENFDVAINISTLEEVNFDHVNIFHNLYKQVKPGGILICTFDIPGLQVNNFESLFNKTIDRFDNELNNHNSKTPAFSGRNLECGLMVVRK
jgi:hypothetical protein